MVVEACGDCIPKETICRLNVMDVSKSCFNVDKVHDISKVYKLTLLLSFCINTEQLHFLLATYPNTWEIYVWRPPNWGRQDTRIASLNV